MKSSIKQAIHTIYSKQFKFNLHSKQINMDTTFYSLDDAIKFKSDNEIFIGKYSKSEETELIKIVILQMTPSEFGKLWADQREIFEDPDISKVLNDKEFEEQLIAFDNLDMTKKEGCFYEVVGVLRLANREARFQPMQWLLSDGFE